MALITTLAALGAVVLFCFLVTSTGHLLLRWWKLNIGDDAEHLLCSAALGVLLFETGVFLLEGVGRLQITVPVLLVAVAITGIFELQHCRPRFSRIVGELGNRTPGEKILLAMILAVLLFQGIASMAPLTGSDALHYHFAAPLLILREGWHANFFNVHNFFIGQGHLLILTGLALGSEKVALGLLFLGGVLTAAAAGCLAANWLPHVWASVVALAFLLTPIVFWQMTSAGAPDLWMAFFAAMGVLAVSRCTSNSPFALAAVAGIMAGGVAGTKYTGCFIAASLALAFFWETRSLRHSAIFVGAALAAGIWPFARNILWTGDPVFPFLLGKLGYAQVNNYTLGAIRADTGAADTHSLLHILKFPFFAGIDQAHLGFWQFFSPLCLLFAPLILFAVRNTPIWRTSLIVWVASSIAIGVTSGMTRFLLPIWPIALAVSFAGITVLSEKQWRIAKSVAIVSVGFFLLMGVGGLLLYGRSPALAAAGFISRQSYLVQRAPEYAKSEFVNRALNNKGNGGKVLIFFRHTYYLQVPFVSGDPASSWLINPERLKTPESWGILMQENGIHWVVRAPDYPPTISEPLHRLEVSGKLVPLEQGQVDDFEGIRILGNRKTLPIVILEVKD